MEQATNNPWAGVEARYQPGQQVQGSVTRIAQFGVFVQIEPGLEGIVYAFELGQELSAIAGIEVGQEMRLYVKSIDVGKKRLELGLQNESMPGLLGANEMPPAIQRSKPREDHSWLPSFPLPDGARTHDERHCPTCLRSIQRVWKYCVYCGGSLLRSCPVCGTAQPDLPDAHFCCECGQVLS